MRRFGAIAVVATLAFTAAPARSDSKLPQALQVLGNVTTAARPVANALIIALSLNDFGATRTWTATDGTFSLPPLRTGIYKIIAVKQGFLPAITTVVPTRADHRVTLRLQNEKQAGRKDANDEIWELRGSLPADILRDLDFMLQPPDVVAYEVPRLRGEMMSMTGVASQTAAPTFAQTALGVQSRIGDTLQLGFKGNLRRIDDPTDNDRFGTPLAESKVMAMELRSSPTEAYRVASTQSWWRYADGEERQADVRAHNFEWEHGPARVQVRYFAQDNLFHDEPFGSNTIEVAGNARIFQTRRSDLGVALRVTQESLSDATADTLRTADLAANGTFEAGSAVILHYGMASRVGVGQYEWAPRTGAEWKIGERTSLLASGMYKVVDRNGSTVVPRIVFWSDESAILPRYAYSFGVASGANEKNRLTAIATVAAIDSPLRVILTDGADQFWDGLFVESGDLRKDVRVAWRKEIGPYIVIDIATLAGTVTQRDEANVETRKTYVTGDLQSTFSPTGTTLAVSYREIQQPREEGVDYRTERMSVRMAQSLYLPVDVKLLVGLELARAENSPFLLDTIVPEGESRKYIGGLALNF